MTRLALIFRAWRNWRDPRARRPEPFCWGCGLIFTEDTNGIEWCRGGEGPFLCIPCEFIDGWSICQFFTRDRFDGVGVLKRPRLPFVDA